MSAPLPPLTPQSQRIQDGIAHFGVLRPLGVTSRPLPEFVSIDVQIKELAVLTEEHLRPPIVPETRPLERPSAVEGWMGVCTAQFILRNTHRVTRDDVNPDRMAYARTEAARIAWHTGTARDVFGERGGIDAQLTTGEIASYVAKRARLMVEPWPDHFGRPDPVAVQDD